MPRTQPLELSQFSDGVVIKGDLVGKPGIRRLEGLYFDRKLGALTNYGGLVELPAINQSSLGSDIEIWNGFKRWYRGDGGSNFLGVVKRTGSAIPYLLHVDTAGVVSLLDTLTGMAWDDEAPVIFENCDDQILVMPDGMLSSPWAVKLAGEGSNGGINAAQLGLVAPTQILTLSTSELSGAGIESNRIGGFGAGATYKWCFTYEYGTKDARGKYGESAPSPVVTHRFGPGVAAQSFWRVTLSGLSLSGTNMRRVNLYRTLENEDTFYKVNSTILAAATQFVDDVHDDLVDLSSPLTTYPALPPVLRVARWYNNRVYGFGIDGKLRSSAAGFPDIWPPNNFWAIGQVYARGESLGVVRDRLFAFKRDGVFLIDGLHPRHVGRKVDGTGCGSRCCTVDMPDGVYFLGEDGRVYRFTGESSIPLSAAVDTLLEADRDLFFKKAFATRVGDEYQISVPCSNLDYVAHATQHNNLILAYNYKYKAWRHVMAQAGVIECCDGLGDSGEVYITEADNTRGASAMVCGITVGLPDISTTAAKFAPLMKGMVISGVGIPANTTLLSVSADGNAAVMSANASLTNAAASLTFLKSNVGWLYRFDRFAKNIPVTYMVNGLKNYTKDYSSYRHRIEIGPLYNPENPWLTLTLHKVVVYIRQCGHAAGVLKLYNANLSGEPVILTPTAESVSDFTVDDANTYDTGVYDTAVAQPMQLIRQEFTGFTDTDIAYTLVYELNPDDTDLSLGYEIVGIEVLHETGNNQ